MSGVKRVLACLMAFCMVLYLLTPMSVQASDYQEITIRVFDGNTEKDYPVLYLADDFYFSAEDYQIITRYRFSENENSLSYQRGEKRIVVSKTTGEYHIFGLGVKGTVQVVVHNGITYLPASELLPWMNVSCAVKEGVLQVIPDNASIWDALDGLTYEDYAFNLYQEFGDSTSSVVALSAMTVFDTVINLRFDRLIPVDISTDGGFSMTTLYDYECYINTLTYLLKDEKTFSERLEGDLGKYGKWNSYLDDILEKTGNDEKKIQLAIDDYYRICGDTETGELLYDGTQTWLYVREFFRDYDKVAKYMDVFLVLKLCEVVMETDYEYKEYIQWLSGRETGNAVFDKALAETSRLLNENEGIILAYYLNLFSKVAEEIPDTVVNAIANNTMNDTVINLCNSYKSGFFGSVNQYMSIAKIIYSTIIPVTKGYEAIAKVNVTETIQDYCWQLAAKLEQGEMTQENIARVRQSYLTALRTSRMAFEGKQEIMDLKLFGVITVLDGEGLLDGFLKRLDEKVLELTASVDATENDSVEGKTEYTKELKQMFRELMESSNRNPLTGDNPVALLAYAKMLQNGVWLRLDNGDQIPASHYSLLDMNADGCSEIIVFAVDNYVPTFEIYTYTEGDVLGIADSLDTCDVSRWYNAGNYVYICDGRYVFAGADKATAAYQASSFALLKYNGQSVNAEESNLYDVLTGYDVCKLVECGEIVGGIEIGSDEDLLKDMIQPPATKPSGEHPAELIGRWCAYERSDGADYGWVVDFYEDGTGWIEWGLPEQKFTYEAYNFSWSAEADGHGFYVTMRSPDDRWGTFLYVTRNNGQLRLERNDGMTEDLIANVWYERDLDYEAWLDRQNDGEPNGQFAEFAEDGQYDYSLTASPFFEGDSLYAYLWTETRGPADWQAKGMPSDICSIQFENHEIEAGYLVYMQIDDYEIDTNGELYLRGTSLYSGWEAECRIGENGDVTYNDDSDHTWYGTLTELAFAMPVKLVLAEECEYWDARNGYYDENDRWVTEQTTWGVIMEYLTGEPDRFVDISIVVANNRITKLEIPYYA